MAPSGHPGGQAGGVFPGTGAASTAPQEVAHGAGQPVRASDAEREAVVERLRLSCAEGRLTLEELGSRVADVYGAVYRGDLERVVADLPVAEGEAAVPSEVRPSLPAARRARRWIVTVMGSVSRRGHWRLPAAANVVTVLGETDLDLRQAVIEGPEIELKLFVVMGEQRVRVPEGVEVEVSGFVFMGERHVNVAPVPPRPGVPRLHLVVAGIMGEVKVTDR